MKLRNILTGKCDAVTMHIIIFLLILGVGGFLLAVLDIVGTQLQTWGTTNFGVGVYNPDALSFMNTTWVYLPLILIMTGVLYLLIRAQRRAPTY